MDNFNNIECKVEELLSKTITNVKPNLAFLCFLGIRLASIQQHACYITAMADVIGSSFLLPRQKIINILKTNEELFESYSKLKLEVINSINNPKSIYYEIVHIILGSTKTTKKEIVGEEGKVTIINTLKINQSWTSGLFRHETLPGFLSISSEEQDLSDDNVIPILKEEEKVEVNIIKKSIKKKIEKIFDKQQREANEVLFSKENMHKYKTISAGGAVRCGKTLLMTYNVLKRIEYIYSSKIEDLKRDYKDDKERSKGQVTFLGKTAPSCYQNIFMGILDGWKLNTPAMKSFVWNVLNFKIRILGIGKLALESLKGITSDILYVDEAENLSEEGYNMLISRISNPWSKLYLCWNPKTPSHWISKLTNDKEKMEESLVNHFNFSLADCEFACPKFIKMLENNYGKDSSMYKRFVLGIPASVSGTIYSMFNEEKCCVEGEIDLSKYEDIYIGYDHGHRSPRVYIAIGIYINNKGVSECHVLDELYYHHGHCDTMTHTRYMHDLKVFANKYEEKLRYIYLPHDAMDMKKLLYPIYNISNATRKLKVLDGIGLIQIMFSDGRLKIHSGCKNLIRELYLYTYKEDCETDIIEKEFDHSCDALRYAITSCNVFSKEIVDEEGIFEEI